MAPEDASAAIEDVDIFEEEAPMNRRQRAQAQRERLRGDSEPLLSGAQTANLLAGLTGVARQSIISIEKERYLPNIETALLISKSLNVPVAELFWLEDEPR